MVGRAAGAAAVRGIVRTCLCSAKVLLEMKLQRLIMIWRVNINLMQVCFRKKKRSIPITEQSSGLLNSGCLSQSANDQCLAKDRKTIEDENKIRKYVKDHYSLPKDESKPSPVGYNSEGNTILSDATRRLPQKGGPMWGLKLQNLRYLRKFKALPGDTMVVLQTVQNKTPSEEKYYE